MELRSRQRLFLSLFFLLSGFCFASWASRIPTIKMNFSLNDAALGSILLSMPISSLIGLPLSGWMVSRFDSRIPLAFGFSLLAVSILSIGLADQAVWLIASISLFSFSTRILNIALNTQAITLQKMYDRKINGSFHGLWSLGGIFGVAFCTVLVAKDVSIELHFVIVSILTLLITVSCFRFLLKNDRSTSGNKLSFSKPDPYIVYLGVIVFFAAICEGGMFDWSGVYFREVVEVEVFTWGYLLFMICMATSRFASDKVIERFGMQKTYVASSVLIVTGILLSVIFPSFWPSLIGFCLVGFGTASVIPMTFTLAGNSKKYSPGMAISIIATYSIVGMLIGPPMIGYVSHAVGLQYSFLIFAFAGLMLIPISKKFFSYEKSLIS